MRETNIAQREPPGCPPNQYPLVRPLDFPKADFPSDRKAPQSPQATGIPFPPTTETLQVNPATSDTSGGTCSILIRTGIRCASRTQVKIGSTFGRPCVLLAAFAALMPPVILSILPLIGAWKPSSVASTGSPTWMLASFVSSK